MCGCVAIHFVLIKYLDTASLLLLILLLFEGVLIFAQVILAANPT